MARQNKQKTNIFRISLTDAENHRGIWDLSFTRLGFVLVIISALVVLFGGALALLSFTPLKTLIPGYPNAHTQRAAIQNAIKIDSLERVISRWELYSDNLVRVLDGEAPLSIDSILTITAAPESEHDAAFLARQDSLLREGVNRQEQFELAGNAPRALPIEGLHFFTPLKGVVSQGFNANFHPYVEITAPAGSVVMAALGGTVISDGWNDETLYTITIQHENDIVTIYKHNQKLLKHTGDKVSAGSSIALSGESGDGDAHLRFELWVKGESVDPSQYISF